MDIKNFFDSRLIDEPSMQTMQANIDKAISQNVPELWGRVLEGLETSFSLGVLEVQVGFGIGRTGERIVLRETFSWQVSVSPEIVYLSVGFKGKKVPIGEMEDAEGNKQPESFQDSAAIYILGKTQEDIDNGEMGEVVFTTETDPESVYQNIKVEDTPQLLELARQTGSTFARTQKNANISSLLWWAFLQRTMEGEEEQEEFSLDEAESYLEETKQSFLNSQTVSRGTIKHLHVDPPELGSRLVSLIEGETRWRVANGQDLPADSRLRKSGATKVLDLRNRFIRSWNEEELLGRYQEDSFQRFSGQTGRVMFPQYTAGSGSGVIRTVTQGDANGWGNNDHFSAGYIQINTDLDPALRTSNETRPKNVMLLTFQLT